MADFLASLGPLGAGRVAPMLRRRVFEHAETVASERYGRHAGAGFHIVESGWFLVQLSSADGRSLGMTVEGPGSVFGELSLMSEPSLLMVTARALQPAVTMTFDPAEARQLRGVAPELDRALVGLLAARVEQLTVQLADAASLSTRTRLCRLLVNLHPVFAPHPIPLTQTELAGLVHSTRQTVNALLNGLADEGLVTTGRARVTVDHVDGLQSLIGAELPGRRAQRVESAS